MKPRNPDRFLPSNDLVWVVYLNRQREVRGVIEGRATAEEVARRLWPDIDLHAGWSSLGTSALAWVRDRLEHEARSCQRGGAGRLLKAGEDYVGHRPDGAVPHWLAE